MASKVATQPIPANQRKLGSDRNANLLNGFESRPLEAEVDEVDALSSSALRSFEGVKFIGFVPSGFFSGNDDTEVELGVVLVVVDEDVVVVIVDWGVGVGGMLGETFGI